MSFRWRARIEICTPAELVECVILLVAETEVKTVMSPTTVQPVKRLAVTKSFGRRGVSFEVLARSPRLGQACDAGWEVYTTNRTYQESMSRMQII